MNGPDFGALVVSLDFELYWGVTDLYRPPSLYDEQVLGARQVIPKLLDLFEETDISATWCAVGMLFAKCRSDAERYYPSRKPQYADPCLCAYQAPAEGGEIFNYAPELIAAIVRRKGQEIGTHTFSHYYCLEPGQGELEFEADLAAAVRIAGRQKLQLSSIGFPRNEINRAYLNLLPRHGIVAYRGTSSGWMYATGLRREQRDWKRRAARLADAYLNLAGDNTFRWRDIPDSHGTYNIRASRYFRPYVPGLGTLERRRIQRIVTEMERAARAHRLYHLWWHPEDMGRHSQYQLENLRTIFEAYRRCRDHYGMRSLGMRDAAIVAKQLPHA
jgi:peptidoglycan/xylan/chitin deacetylase (PgdA/CDA1 family)